MKKIKTKYNKLVDRDIVGKLTSVPAKECVNPGIDNMAFKDGYGNHLIRCWGLAKFDNKIQQLVYVLVDNDPKPIRESLCWKPDKSNMKWGAR